MMTSAKHNWTRIAAVVLSGAFSGCYYDNAEVLYGSGASNGQNASGSPCDTSVVITYNGEISALLNAHCTGCHSGVAPSGGKDYTTYEAVRQATLEGSLLSRINLPSSSSQSMPPIGPLDSCTIAVFESWAALGAPEF